MVKIKYIETSQLYYLSLFISYRVYILQIYVLMLL